LDLTTNLRGSTDLDPPRTIRCASSKTYPSSVLDALPSAPYRNIMMRHWALRLRVVAAVLVLAFNLVGQGLMPGAMATPTTDIPVMTMAATATEMCPNCMKRTVTAGHHCTVGVCSPLMAVLPTSTCLNTGSRARHHRAVQSEPRGITVPPEIGPPRPFGLA
jgi:hypothetical protein